MKNISILGVTGSIGIQTLDVVRKSNGEFKIVGVSANCSVEKMKEVIVEFEPEYVAMMDEKSSVEISKFCIKNNYDIDVSFGMEGLIKISTLAKIDTVVTSVVGMIGLKPTIEAIRAKKKYCIS